MTHFENTLCLNVETRKYNDFFDIIIPILAMFGCWFVQIGFSQVSIQLSITIEYSVLQSLIDSIYYKKICVNINVLLL